MLVDHNTAIVRATHDGKSNILCGRDKCGLIRRLRLELDLWWVAWSALGDDGVAESQCQHEALVGFFLSAT